MRKKCQIGHLYTVKKCFSKTKLQFFNTWIRIQIRIQNADQDPPTQINAMQILANPESGLGLLTQGPDKACSAKQIKCADKKTEKIHKQKMGKMRKLRKWQNAPAQNTGGKRGKHLTREVKSPPHVGQPTLFSCT
jgi:hypothetical protein